MNTGAVMVPPFDDSKKYMIEPDQTYEPHIQVFMPLELKSKLYQRNNSKPFLRGLSHVELGIC